MTAWQKAAFAAGVLAAVIGAAAVLTRPFPFPSGRAGGAAPPVLLPRLQQLLDERGEELEYRIDINGVPAGSLRSVVRSDQREGGRCLVFDYTIQSGAALDRIWPFGASGRTVMNPLTFLPQTSESTTRSGDREKKVTTTFDRQSGIATVTAWDSDDDETKRKEVRFDLGLDVPAAFLFMRVSKMPLGSPRKLTVLKGDDRYEATFTAVGTGTATLEAGTFAAIEVDVSIRKLEDEAGQEEASAKGRRNARVWLSEELRVPLRFECAILAGRIEAELVGPPAAFAELGQ